LNIITPVAGKSNTHIDNSIDFIQQVIEIKIEEGDQMVAFDVVNLFTIVPRKEAMQELQERLEHDHKLLDRTVLCEQKILELVNLCLDSTYFQSGEHFYEQTSGLAMGSPLSPILADLFMEKIKETIEKEDKEKHIKFWKRYVDDVLAIITKEGNPEEILLRANISRTVKFTLEKEKDGCLPFLHVQITQQEERLLISVYRKKTDSERYLHYESNHPRSVKVGVAACLLNRAKTHCSQPGDRRKEQEKVKSALKSNGYPNNVVSEVLQERRTENSGRKEGIQRFGGDTICGRSI
jgi:hypothetical protein